MVTMDGQTNRWNKFDIDKLIPEHCEQVGEGRYDLYPGGPVHLSLVHNINWTQHIGHPVHLSLVHNTNGTPRDKLNILSLCLLRESIIIKTGKYLRRVEDLVGVDPDLDPDLIIKKTGHGSKPRYISLYTYIYIIYSRSLIW